jgi:hypothetical protein
MHKLDLSLLDDFSRALVEVAHVMQFGASKYERSSWLNMKSSEMRPSLLRHDMKYQLGEEYDEESDLPHLAHKAARCLMELELYLRKEQRNDSPSELMESPYELRYEGLKDLIEEWKNEPTEEEILENYSNENMGLADGMRIIEKQLPGTGIWPGLYN